MDRGLGGNPKGGWMMQAMMMMGIMVHGMGWMSEDAVDAVDAVGSLDDVGWDGTKCKETYRFSA